LADCIMIGGGNSTVANAKAFSDNVGVEIKPYTGTIPPPSNNWLLLLLIGGVAATGIYFLTKKKKK